MMSSTIGVRFAKYKRLVLDMPHPRVLRIMFDNPQKLNSMGAEAHAELTEIWRDIDADTDISAVILTGKGKAFSAGGDFSLVQENIDSFDFRLKSWKEAKDLVYNFVNCSKPVISAIRGPAAGAGLVCGLLADISIVTKTALIDMAIAMRHGESQILSVDLRQIIRRGSRTHRLGVFGG